MAEYNELVQTLTWLLTNRIQQKMDYIHGLLGDGNERVRVSTIPGSPDVDYVYVRPDRFSNRAFKVFNKRVEGQDGDPIIIGELPWEPGLIQVVDMDWQAYKDVGWGDDVTSVNRHGITHQWRDGAPGIDTFNIYRRQFGDLKTYPGVSGTLDVGVSPYSLDIYGTQYQWHGTQSFSLLGALPAGTGTARMALVYWSSASGTSGYLGVATGTAGSSAEATILNRPVTPEGAIPSAFVRLAGGQSNITEFDIWDAREPFRPGILFGTGTSGLSADMIPISDTSFDYYTGSTIESALEELPGTLNLTKVSRLWENDFGAVALRVDADGRIGINTTAIPHGGIGWAKLAIDGEDTDAAGPHIQITTAVDDYPIRQDLHLGHDNISLNFDSYWDGSWKSSDAGSNFQIYKTSDLFQIRYDSGISQGSAVTWNDGLTIDTSGNTGIGTASPGDRLDILGGTLQIRIADVSTDATNKLSRIVGRHYTNSEEDITQMNLNSTVSDTEVAIGGGDTPRNAVTLISFWTAADNTTQGGTERMRIDNNGQVGIGVDPASRLDIGAGAIGIAQMAAPGAGATGTVTLYADDNGAGKTRLMAIFNTGIAQQVAIQP